MSLQIYTCIWGSLITHISNGKPSKADLNAANQKALFFSFASPFLSGAFLIPIATMQLRLLWSVRVHYKPDLLSDPVYLLSAAAAAVAMS